MKKIFLYTLTSLAFCFNATAQKKKKIATPPPVMETVKVSVPESGEEDYPRMPVPVSETREVKSSAKKVAEKKYPSEPFVFFPMADTVAKQEDIQRNEAQLKNYSSGNFPNKKMPVIKSIKEIYFDLKNNRKDTTRQYGDGWNEHSLFDKNGNITRLHVIYLDEKAKKDSSYLTTNHLYRGDKLARKEHFWYATGSKIATEEFEYDAKGKKTKEFYFALDEYGNTIQEPGRGSWSVFKYPNANQEIEEKYERREDAENFYVLQSTVFRKLNSQGKIINEERVEWPNKDPYSTFSFVYDEKGNLIKSISSFGETTTTYNKNGDAIKEIKKLEDASETTTYTYKYDKNNNWVQRVSETVTENKNGKQEKSTPLLCKRIIEYY